MSAPAVLLETRGLSKNYGAVVALRSGDLSVQTGEIHALMGANGAGKSTLVKVLTGDVTPNAGVILLDGREVRFGSPASARKAGLASVYQDVSLVPLLTIEQNLRLTGTTMAAISPWLKALELEDVDLTEVHRRVHHRRRGTEGFLRHLRRLCVPILGARVDAGDIRPRPRAHRQRPDR